VLQPLQQAPTECDEFMALGKLHWDVANIAEMVAQHIGPDNVDRAMSADAKIHSASPRCDVPCEAEPNSNLGRALWSARNRSNLPMSDAATDMKQHTYTPRLHESHQVLANNRKKHRRDGYDLPPRAIRPEVKPGLTSQEVGWHVGTHPCKGPDHPHIQSPMSLFRHEMMHTGQTSVLERR